MNSSSLLKEICEVGCGPARERMVANSKSPKFGPLTNEASTLKSSTNLRETFPKSNKTATLIRLWEKSRK